MHYGYSLLEDCFFNVGPVISLLKRYPTVVNRSWILRGQSLTGVLYQKSYTRQNCQDDNLTAICLVVEWDGMNDVMKQILKLASHEDLGHMSYREIGRTIGGVHPQTVKNALEKLISNGMLTADVNRNIIRKVDPSKTTGSLVPIPIFGSANAGPATIFADETLQGYLQISKTLLPKDIRKIFAVRVSGNSMNNARVKGNLIEDGDYALVDASQTDPRDGIVLSTIDDVANVKRLSRDEINGRIILSSDSKEDFAPIYIDADDTETYRINGVVIDVMKVPK